RRKNRNMTKAKMDIHQVLKQLPHRYPFVMVDRVLEIEPGKSIKALKNVTINEPYFVGHFPHRPVMPGVMIVEALAQTAALLGFDTLGVTPDSKTMFYFAGIDGARFKRPVEPGDQLILYMEVERVRAGIWKFKGHATVGEDLVTEMAQLHPTAIVSPTAQLHETVQVGAFTIIGDNVRVAANTSIGSHCVIEGHTQIDCDNQIASHNSIGSAAQDKKYRNEATRLVIGARNTIREFCTINTGTIQGGGVTTIGDDNWIMAYVHIAHDCQVGSHTIMANTSTLAGHVEVGDWAIIGGLTGVHQFTKIGAHAMVGFASAVSQDIAPYMMVDGNPLSVRGINSEGLRRRGFGNERI
ncbi:unnamed protein product, partial [Darwinula stevensoni]